MFSEGRSQKGCWVVGAPSQKTGDQDRLFVTDVTCTKEVTCGWFLIIISNEPRDCGRAFMNHVRSFPGKFDFDVHPLRTTKTRNFRFTISSQRERNTRIILKSNIVRGKTNHRNSSSFVVSLPVYEGASCKIFGR